MITYLKLGGLLALVATLFGGGFYFGSLRSKTALEAFQAAQAENTAKAVLAERASAATELARVDAILKEYQDAPPDPIVTGIAHRVFIDTCPAVGPVPSAGADPARARGAGPVPGGDPEVERLSQAAFDAALHDARELTALQAAWPK